MEERPAAEQGNGLVPCPLPGPEVEKKKYAIQKLASENGVAKMTEKAKFWGAVPRQTTGFVSHDPESRTPARARGSHVMPLMLSGV